jgi:pimeloyl-ACP methyl ester carboxylesterase
MVDFYREPLTLNDQTRAELPGEFIALPDGVTHYEIAGPEDGPPVILIHGFSTPLFIWDKNVDALAEAGCRVVRYDLFGRGYSDRPDGPYDGDLFDRQLLHLIDALGFDRVNLLGVSMGGAITIAFTDRHPDRVDRIGLVDPAGFPMNVTLAALSLFLPVLGEIIMSVAGNKVLVDGLPRDFYLPQRHPEYFEKYKAQLPYRGFKRALLKTMRQMPLTGMAETYARVGQQDRAVLLIWGREDATVPFKLHAEVQAAIPHVQFHPIDESGHIPMYERPEVVNPILIDFFG